MTGSDLKLRHGKQLLAWTAMEAEDTPGTPITWLDGRPYWQQPYSKQLLPLDSSKVSSC